MNSSHSIDLVRLGTSADVQLCLVILLEKIGTQFVLLILGRSVIPLSVLDHCNAAHSLSLICVAAQTQTGQRCTNSTKPWSLKSLKHLHSISHLSTVCVLLVISHMFPALRSAKEILTVSAYLVEHSVIFLVQGSLYFHLPVGCMQRYSYSVHTSLYDQLS